jgi:hypothetical protein
MEIVKRGLFRTIVTVMLIFASYLLLGTGRAKHGLDNQDISVEFHTSCSNFGPQGSIEECVRFYNKTLPIVLHARNRAWPLIDGPDKSQYDRTYKALLAAVVSSNVESPDSAGRMSLVAYSPDGQ